MMNYPALLLNGDYQPISIYPLRALSLKDAVLKTMSGAAVVVETHDAELRSARTSMRPPSIIALKTYWPRKETVPFSRMNVLVRDGFRCQYCQCRLNMSDLTFDHVIPRSQGGPTNFGNIVAACFDCNKRKANKLAMRPIREPVSPDPREMARLRPVRKSDIPASWVPWLESAGIPVIGPAQEDPSRMSRTARDGIYWNGALEESAGA